ncbi:MAG TPA: hypothetical protein VMI06_10060 [Terriglobia bacterium]|nr:hypothetical protein [Terriglobia bacterium]
MFLHAQALIRALALRVHAAELIDAEGVLVVGERILSKTVIWTAGVEPSPAGKWLNVETDRAGRVRVLRVPGHPEIFVVGDTASLDQDGKPLPGVAQVVIQGGARRGGRFTGFLRVRPASRPFAILTRGEYGGSRQGLCCSRNGLEHRREKQAISHGLGTSPKGLGKKRKGRSRKSRLRP